MLQMQQYFMEKKSQPILGGNHQDEFTFIGSTFENLIGEHSSFQKNSERNRLIREKQLFHELMNGGFAGEVKDLLVEMRN